MRHRITVIGFSAGSVLIHARVTGQENRSCIMRANPTNLSL